MILVTTQTADLPTSPFSKEVLQPQHPQFMDGPDSNPQQ